MTKPYFSVSLVSRGKSYVYKTVEGFDAAHRLASALSSAHKGSLAVSYRPLNRPNLTGAARISAYRD